MSLLAMLRKEPCYFRSNFLSERKDFFFPGSRFKKIFSHQHCLCMCISFCFNIFLFVLEILYESLISETMMKFHL
uniref:Uncharacterized protein n=1 Tax=Octopus bimaculoides TaxID=37653 RepID=A0A0L8H0D8_OCTBM